MSKEINIEEFENYEWMNGKLVETTEYLKKWFPEEKDKKFEIFFGLALMSTMMDVKNRLQETIEELEIIVDNNASYSRRSIQEEMQSIRSAISRLEDKCDG